MKVDFKQKATLVITPENEIESYALRKWHEGYVSIEPSEECLCVESITIDDTNNV